MKAAAFAYARATSVVHALELLASHGEGAKVLSGGQSLMPAMNLRLVSPELIVDIGGLAELRGVTVKGEVLVIGALTRHVDLLKSAEIRTHAPLLAEAVAHIAHPAIRNRGTIGGSLAHADPASELPACMLALGATIIVRGPRGERRIAAEQFFTGIYRDRTCAGRIAGRGGVSRRAQGLGAFLPRICPQAWRFCDRRPCRAGRCCRAKRSPSCASAILASATSPLLAAAARRLIGVAVTPAVLADASRRARRRA